jgi:hypothetical protein
MSMSTLASSMDTSLYTVVKTNHLTQRQVRVGWGEMRVAFSVGTSL